MHHIDTVANTDTLLFLVAPDSRNSDGCFMTAGRALGIHVGGSVYVKPLKEWHRLARLAGGDTNMPPLPPCEKTPNVTDCHAAETPPKPALRIEANVLHFGCLRGQSGHHLHDKQDPHRRYESTPWGYALDGALCPKGCPSGCQDGLVMFKWKGGWTALGIQDRTVDTRPGSHSAFLVDKEMTAAQLLQAAKEQWPEVFARFPFTLQLP